MFQRPRRQVLNALQPSQHKVEVRNEGDFLRGITTAQERYARQDKTIPPGFLFEIVEPLVITNTIIIPVDTPGVTVWSPARLSITAAKDMDKLFEVRAENCTFSNLSVNGTNARDIGMMFHLADTAQFATIENVTAHGQRFVGGSATPPANTVVSGCLFFLHGTGLQPAILMGSLGRAVNNTVPRRIDCTGRYTAITGNAVPGITVYGAGAGGCSIANNMLDGAIIDTTGAAHGSTISGNATQKI